MNTENSVLTVECDSKYQQWDWRMQSMKHRPGTDWPVKSDVRSGTSLISLNDWTTAQVHSVMGSRVPSDVCSALPLLSRHICSLCGGMCIDMQASFLLTFCQCGPRISLSKSNYCWSLSVIAIHCTKGASVSVKYANRYIIFTDTETLWVFTHRYLISL